MVITREQVITRWQRVAVIGALTAAGAQLGDDDAGTPDESARIAAEYAACAEALSGHTAPASVLQGAQRRANTALRIFDGRPEALAHLQYLHATIDLLLDGDADCAHIEEAE